MSLGNVVDEFLNQYGFANTSATEQADLSTASVWSKQVDNLDTSLQDFSSSRLLNEGRRVGMDRGKLDTFDGAPLVNWLTNDVHDTTQSTLPDRDPDGGTSVDNFLTTDETLGTVHGDCSDRVLTEVSSDLENETTTVEVLNLKSIQDRW